MTSYSFHIGNKNSAITNQRQLKSVSKHNLRLYKKQEDENGKKFDKTKIVTLIGTSNLYEDVESLYKKEFTNAINKYNENKKDCRKIKDYFKHISDNNRNDLAVEIIIQVGNKEYWQNKSWKKKKKMNEVFIQQIEKLKELVPNFAIANATVHYDEASPHLHIVGVPIAFFDKGLEKRVSKSRVFTKEKLEELQVEMRKDLPFKLKPKEKGRNRDLSVAEYKALMDHFKREPAKMKFIEKTYIPFNKVLVDRSELSDVLEENKDLQEKVSEQAEFIAEINKDCKKYVKDLIQQDLEKKENEQKYEYTYNKEKENQHGFLNLLAKVKKQREKENQHEKTKKVNRNHDDMELY